MFDVEKAKKALAAIPAVDMIRWAHIKNEGVHFSDLLDQYERTKKSARRWEISWTISLGAMILVVVLMAIPASKSPGIAFALIPFLGWIIVSSYARVSTRDDLKEMEKTLEEKFKDINAQYHRYATKGGPLDLLHSLANAYILLEREFRGNQTLNAAKLVIKAEEEFNNLFKEISVFMVIRREEFFEETR